MIELKHLIEMLLSAKVSASLPESSVNLTMQIETEEQRGILSQILKDYEGNGLDCGTGKHIIEVTSLAALYRMHAYLRNWGLTFSMQIDLHQ